MNTEILVITDRSGSMENIRSDVIGGYNTLMAEQKKQHGEARVTYAQFDTMYEVLYAGKPVAEVPELTHETFVPRGGTALLDAIGKTLDEQGKRIAKENWAALVVCVIVTDGHENSSWHYNHEQVKRMIEHAKEHGWLFVYVAADQNSFDVGRSMGISGARGQTMTFDKTAQGTCDAYYVTTQTLSSARAGVMPAEQKEELKVTTP